MLAWVESYCAHHRLPLEIINAVSLSLDELVTNIISYGYGDSREHTIEATLLHDEHHVTVRLIDDARPFNPIAKSEVDVSTSLDEKPIGGLGIHLVKNLMDDICYERVDEKNVLTLRKKREDTYNSQKTR